VIRIALRPPLAKLWLLRPKTEFAVGTTLVARLELVFLAVMLLRGNVLAAEAKAAPKPDASVATIPAGTRITADNWAQYKEFMSEGMIALFEGIDFWHLPSDMVVEVGPTISIPLPRKYMADTKEYSNQVRLVRLPTGGYVPQGYVAGLPFPDPLKGDPALSGQRIFWNSYYRYQPRVQGALNYSYTLDREGNMTQTSETKAILSQLAFLSDIGFLRAVPDAGSYYSARYSEQIAPEQSKYTILLDLLPTDPTQFDELYEYVPTLRRSLRLSQAARCAPVFGSDYVVDDESDGPPGLPQLYKIDYLGEKKLLALEHATPEAFDSPGTSTQLDAKYYYKGSVGVVPFPKPAAGRWELRDAYVISMERLPHFAKGYCYGKRVIYIDKENYFGGAQLDLYDSDGHLYKSQLILSYPEPIPGTAGDTAELVAGPNTSFLINFKDKHLSISAALRSCVNSDCAANGYLDVNSYASPEGLLKIVQ